MRVQQRLQWLSGVCAGLVLWMSPVAAGDWTFSGEIAPELRGYIEAPKYGKTKNPLLQELQKIVRNERPNFFFPFTGQSDQRLWPSIAGNVTAEYDWNDEQTSSCSRRSGVSPKTMTAGRTPTSARAIGSTSATIGTRSSASLRCSGGSPSPRHLVDIVNQDDQVEDIDGDAEAWSADDQRQHVRRLGTTCRFSICPIFASARSKRTTRASAGRCRSISTPRSSNPT